MGYTWAPCSQFWDKIQFRLWPRDCGLGDSSVELLDNRDCGAGTIHDLPMGRYGGFHKWEVPQNGWLIMENPTKMDGLGVPLFQETTMSLRYLSFYLLD